MTDMTTDMMREKKMPNMNTKMKQFLLLVLFAFLFTGCKKTPRISHARTHKTDLSNFDRALCEGYVLTKSGIIHATGSCSAGITYEQVLDLHGEDGHIELELSYIGGYSICAKCIPPSKIDYVRSSITNKYKELIAEEISN